MGAINDLCKEAYERAVQAGFYDGPKQTVGDRIALMHSELSEALEEFRAGHKPDEVYFSGGSRDENGVWLPGTKPEGVPIELADCVIRILDFCGANGIDLEEALRLKLTYNQTRSYRHGNKVI